MFLPRRTFLQLAGLGGLGVVARPQSYLPTAPAATPDLVILGGTPGGIMTAIAAARLGRSSLILERSAHLGGLPANGLGATDIHTRGATTGLFTEFVERVRQAYVARYGSGSAQVKDCSNGYHFEPNVCAGVFAEMLREQAARITVLTQRQFDFEPENLTMQNRHIRALRVTNLENGTVETHEGRFFIDATYEGDLIAAAGVPYAVGREGRDEYHELGAGRVYKYWLGEEGPGSTFQGDNAVQSYNYRLCLTNVPENRVLFEKPASYRREEYLSLVDDVLTGWHTGMQVKSVTEAQRAANRERVARGLPPEIPGMPKGIWRLTNMVRLPNGKVDANCQHLAFISTDLPEENWPYPTSTWAWRDQFAQRLRDYTTGLFYFAQNDPALPEWFRRDCREWGLAKDEYGDNGHFPRQLYVRAGRRMRGQHFFTANDALPVEKNARPPLHADSITASHYALDSHAVRKREPGRVHLDGFFSYDTKPYTVPYGVLVPKAPLDNLLAAVPVSGSHIGFSTLRMEPCWMALGQAAGVAASLCLDRGVAAKDAPIRQLQDALLSQKATLIYYRDLTPDHPQFTAIQRAGLKGWLPDWMARPDEALTAAEETELLKKSGLTAPSATPAGTSRGQYLTHLLKLSK